MQSEKPVRLRKDGQPDRRTGAHKRTTFRRKPIGAKGLTHDIFQLIDEDRLKLSVLADIAGLTRNHVVSMRAGHNTPSLKTLNKLAEAAGLEIIVRRKK